MRTATSFLALAFLSMAPCARAQMAVEYYHLDAVGTVLAVTNEAGALVEEHDYDVFGQEVGAQAGTQPERFAGKERDGETGWDYFGARYYGSRVGRFTTVDPVIDQKAALANPQLWNRYAYGRNNPMRYVDPDGRLTFEADPKSRNAVSAGDIQHAKDAQKALRETLTPEVKAYFQNQFGQNLESLLADNGGPVVQLSSGTLNGQVGQCKNGPGCQIRLNLDYAVGDLQAGMVHELGHNLERAGGKTYTNVIFDQKLDADAGRAASKGGTYRFAAPNLKMPSERASYYGEIYQFKEVRTFWATPKN